MCGFIESLKMFRMLGDDKGFSWRVESECR